MSWPRAEPRLAFPNINWLHHLSTKGRTRSLLKSTRKWGASPERFPQRCRLPGHSARHALGGRSVFQNEILPLGPWGNSASLTVWNHYEKLTLRGRWRLFYWVQVSKFHPANLVHFGQPYKFGIFYQLKWTAVIHRNLEVGMDTVSFSSWLWASPSAVNGLWEVAWQQTDPVGTPLPSLETGSPHLHPIVFGLPHA